MRLIAYQLAERGFRVFPIRENGKLPAFEGWQEWATDDPGKVLLEWPDGNYNVGILTTGLIVLDADKKKGGLESLAKLNLPRTYTVRTAGGGLHLVYRAPPGVEVANRVSRQRKDGTIVSPIAGAPGIDIRGKGGLIVAAGSSVNGVTYKPEDDGAPDVCPSGIVHQLMRAPDARSPLAGKVVTELDQPHNLEWARTFLATEGAKYSAAEGGRNDATYQIACKIGDRGISYDAACELLEPWNEQHCGLETDEFERTIRNAYEYRQGAVGRDDPLRALEAVAVPNTALPPDTLERARDVSLAEIIAREDRALVAGLFGPGELVTVYGDSGAGKSFVTLDLAWAVAQGRPWHGIRTRKGPMLYVSLEGVDGFRKRMLAAKAKFGDPGDYLARLKLHISLVRTEEGLKGAATIIAACQKFAAEVGEPVAGIVIDTLARATAGDNENDVADMMHFVEQRAGPIARITGAAVLIVHHTNKTGSIRGSSSLKAACEAVLRIDRDDMGRRCTAEKVKDGEERKLFDFDLEQLRLGENSHGVPVTSCVVTETTESVQRAIECQQVTEALLRMAVDTGEHLSPDSRAANYAARRFVDEQPVTAFGRFTVEEFGTALSRLLQTGRIIKEPYGREREGKDGKPRRSERLTFPPTAELRKSFDLIDA